MIERRLWRNMDWGLLASAVLIGLIGVATIFSAAHRGPDPNLYLRQLAFLAVGTAGLVAVLLVDYRSLTDHGPLLYVGAIVVLAYVLFFGPRIAGTQRWLMIGPLQIQPSEFVKLIAALFVAKVFAESRADSPGLAELIGPGFAVAVLVLLIAAQPDLGTAFCLVPLFVTVAFLAGLRIRALAWLTLIAVLVGGFGWQFMLRDYQKARIYTFIDPTLDPMGTGYQKIQSEIAVGSGGLVGKGFQEGSQSQLGYLPARQTDFIFSVWAEEQGFLGVAAVLGLYFLLLWRCFEAAAVARDRAGAFLVAGIAATLTFQVVYNVAMVAGLVPVKGLPLPLMSYGGSSLLSTLLGIGLILNVRMRRFAN